MTSHNAGQSLKKLFCVAALLCLSTITSTAHATLITNVDVVNSTDISVTMSGTLEGPAPLINNVWMFIILDPSVTPTNWSSCQGGSQVSGDLSGNSYFCTINNSFFGGYHIEVRFENGFLNPGVELSGTSTFSMSAAHGLSTADFIGADVYWGNGNTGVYEGTANGKVTAETQGIPEPSSLLLLGIGFFLLGFYGRKKALL